MKRYLIYFFVMCSFYSFSSEIETITIENPIAEESESFRGNNFFDYSFASSSNRNILNRQTTTDRVFVTDVMNYLESVYAVRVNVDQLISKYGYPVWDRSRTFQNQMGQVAITPFTTLSGRATTVVLATARSNTGVWSSGFWQISTQVAGDPSVFDSFNLDLFGTQANNEGGLDYLSEVQIIGVEPGPSDSEALTIGCVTLTTSYVWCTEVWSGDIQVGETNCEDDPETETTVICFEEPDVYTGGSGGNNNDNNGTGGSGGTGNSNNNNSTGGENLGPGGGISLEDLLLEYTVINGTAYSLTADGVLHIHIDPIDMATSTDAQKITQIMTVLNKLHQYFCKNPDDYHPINWYDYFDNLAGGIFTGYWIHPETGSTVYLTVDLQVNWNNVLMNTDPGQISGNNTNVYTWNRHHDGSISNPVPMMAINIPPSSVDEVMDFALATSDCN